MNKQRDVHIAGCCNGAYLPHLCAVFLSVIETHKECGRELIFHVLYEDNIPAAELEKFRGALAGQTLHLYPVGAEQVAGLSEIEHIPSLAAWYRVLIPGTLSDDIDRVLYLDCDTIIVDSLLPLYDMDMPEGYHFGAVANVIPDDFEEYVEGIVGSLDENQYFNSGVLLMDLPGLKAMDFTEKVLDYGRNNFCMWLDQCALNAAMVGKWHRLSPKWNAQNAAVYAKGRELTYTAEELRDANETPVVVHFEGHLGKPWAYLCKNPRKHLYLKYRKQTPWNKNIFKDRTFKAMLKKYVSPMLRAIMGESIRKKIKLAINWD